MTTYPEDRVKYYKIIQKHAERVAENTYNIQMSEHLKKGRKKSTFKYKPTNVLKTLIILSSDVLGGRVSIEKAMSYIARDYDFQKERFG